jgi:microcystin-dependent protein
MGDAIFKPSSGDDLVLSNDDESAKIEINEGADISVTIGSSSGDDFNVGSGKLLVEGDTSQVSISGSLKVGSVVNANVPAGMLGPFANNSVPTGWLACDGSAVSRTTYSVLYAVIGTTWGVGDGSSTFNLPDLEGAFLRGTGSHGTSNMADGNDFAGPSVGSYENDQFQNHGHQIRRDIATSDDVQLGVVASGTEGSSASLWTKDTGSGANAPSTINAYNATTNSYGTPRTGDETRPFNAGVKYCIKY